MDYKLEFDQDHPTKSYIRLLSDPFYDVLVLLADMKMTLNEDGKIDDNSLIADFTYKIQEKGTQIDDLLIPDLTNAISVVLCSLINTDMVSNEVE